MTAVLCKFCKFEKERKCSMKKKATVDLNKRRACKVYAVDVDKVVDYTEGKLKYPKPKAALRPDWYWDKSLRKVRGDVQLNEKIFDQYGTTVDKVPDPAHPLTGDLSRFVAPEEKSDEQHN